MEIERKTIVPPPPPEDEVVLTLTMAEARTLYTIMGRTVPSSIDKIFANACDGHVTDFTGSLYEKMLHLRIDPYVSNPLLIEARRKDGW